MSQKVLCLLNALAWPVANCTLQDIDQAIGESKLYLGVRYSLVYS